MRLEFRLFAGRLLGLGFRVWGLGFRVLGLGLAGASNQIAGLASQILFSEWVLVSEGPTTVWVLGPSGLAWGSRP